MNLFLILFFNFINISIQRQIRRSLNKLAYKSFIDHHQKFKRESASQVIKPTHFERYLLFRRKFKNSENKFAAKHMDKYYRQYFHHIVSPSELTVPNNGDKSKFYINNIDF